MTQTRSKPKLKTDTRGYERRLVGAQRIAVRQNEDDESDAIGFEGHAAIFDSPTTIAGWFMEWEEEIARGAFKKTIKEADIRFLINHDPNRLLARNKADTLRLSEDDVGLATDADMAPTSYARDLALSLERGDISQMSFAFEVVKEEWDWDADPPKRTILEVKLWDVAVVTYPAYADTDASLRSAAFDVLCGDMGLTDEARTMLLRSLSSGHEEPDLAPMLEAAGQALQAKARASEPDHHSLETYELLGRELDTLIATTGRSAA